MDLEKSLIIIDKPRGKTSHEVTEIVRKFLGVKKAGHAGTLDPNVTGVLIIGLGKAARILRFLKDDKIYIGKMHLHSDISLEKIKEAIKKKFIGKIKQLPPRKSRVKRIEREREIFSFEILKSKNRDVKFKVHCEAGTYIRKLIHDLGKEINVGAHMSELRRIKQGKFSEKDSITIEKLKNLDKEKIKEILIPIEKALDLPKVFVKKTAVKKLGDGSPLFSDFILKKEEFKKNNFLIIINENKIIEIAKAIVNSNTKRKIIAVPEAVLI